MTVGLTHASELQLLSKNVANVNLFVIIKSLFFPCQVITVALRCVDGAVQKRLFTVE